MEVDTPSLAGTDIHLKYTHRAIHVACVIDLLLQFCSLSQTFAGVQGHSSHVAKAAAVPALVAGQFDYRDPCSLLRFRSVDDRARRMFHVDRLLFLAGS